MRAQLRKRIRLAVATMLVPAATILVAHAAPAAAAPGYCVGTFPAPPYVNSVEVCTP